MPLSPARSGRKPAKTEGIEPESASPAFIAIWTAIAAIPAGSVVSYGEIARRAGQPRRARLVAQALRAAPDDLKLPWHRVLRADGRIAFDRGTRSFRRQKSLLESEGVRVAATGRIEKSVVGRDEDDLDAALWRPD